MQFHSSWVKILNVHSFERCALSERVPSNPVISFAARVAFNISSKLVHFSHSSFNDNLLSFSQRPSSGIHVFFDDQKVEFNLSREINLRPFTKLVQELQKKLARTDINRETAIFGLDYCCLSRRFKWILFGKRRFISTIFKKNVHSVTNNIAMSLQFEGRLPNGAEMRAVAREFRWSARFCEVARRKLNLANAGTNSWSDAGWYNMIVRHGACFVRRDEATRDRQFLLFLSEICLVAWQVAGVTRSTPFKDPIVSVWRPLYPVWPN